MQVNANQNVKVDVAADKVSRNAPARSVESEPAVNFSQAEKLSRAFALAPDERPEEVERARQLLQDTHYPPQETIRRISMLLAVYLESE